MMADFNRDDDLDLRRGGRGRRFASFFSTRRKTIFITLNLLGMVGTAVTVAVLYYQSNLTNNGAIQRSTPPSLPPSTNATDVFDVTNATTTTMNITTDKQHFNTNTPPSATTIPHNFTMASTSTVTRNMNTTTPNNTTSSGPITTALAYSGKNLLFAHLRIEQKILDRLMIRPVKGTKYDSDRIEYKSSKPHFYPMHRIGSDYPIV